MTAVKKWPPHEVTSLQKNLDTLLDVVGDAEKQLTEESRAWLSRLLVVRSSGYLEQVIFECFRGHVEEKSGGLVRAFARSWLERTRNPSPGNLLDFVGRFDQNLRDDFEAFLAKDDDRISRELSFLVATRNSIAHGLNEGIGPKRAMLLAGVAKEAADWFVLNFNPLR